MCNLSHFILNDNDNDDDDDDDDDDDVYVNTGGTIILT